jgi:hypothetical protein
MTILFMVLTVLALGVRANWAWALRGRFAVSAWRGTAGTVAVSLVLLDCLWFIYLFCIGEIGGFASHYPTPRTVYWYFLGPLLVTTGAAFVEGESRWGNFRLGNPHDRIVVWLGFCSLVAGLDSPTQSSGSTMNSLAAI